MVATPAPASLSGLSKLRLLVALRVQCGDVQRLRGGSPGRPGGRDAPYGVDRATALLEDSLKQGYADSVTATVTTQNGLKIVEVTITAPLPVLGLLGPSGSMVVTGRSIMERQ